jgi:hypothetical protein
MGSSLGGLGSLLGTKGQSDNLIAFQALLRTAGFSDYLIRHDHLDKIIFPQGVKHSLLSVALHAVFRQPASREVTTANIQDYLQSNVYVQMKEGTSYIELSYANTDRANAIRILQIILRSGDKVLRQREAASLDEQIRYLSHVIQTTTDIEQLNLFRTMLGEKLASKVLIDTQDTYAFRVFDAPFAPSVPNSPNITILVLLLTAVSTVLGAAAAVGYCWWRENRERGPVS